jgi:hypothetical protein
MLYQLKQNYCVKRSIIIVNMYSVFITRNLWLLIKRIVKFNIVYKNIYLFNILSILK